MRTVLLASLRTHTRRYVAALLAIVIGAVFIVVTAALTSSVRNGLVAGLDAPYEGADAVVDRPTAEQATDLVEGAAAQGAEAWLVGWTLQPVAHDGAVIDTSTDIGQVPDQPDRRWQELEKGGFPGRAGEAVAEVNAAKSAGIVVGDQVRIGSGADALEVTVVGLVTSPSSFAVASLYLPWEDLDRWQDSLYVSSVAWAGPGDQEAATAAIDEIAADSDVMSVDDFVQQVHKEVNSGVDMIRIVALVFATIALLVAVLVINNTFSILFAQRTRDFALLRCVGATRRQVLRSVRWESVALGAIAAVVGVVAGLGAGHGLVALVRAGWPNARLGSAEVGVGWLLTAAIVAMVVTLVAAWLPTRRVTRVSPLAALRPDDSTSTHTGAGRLRVACGLLTVAGGAALLVIAAATATLPVMLAGGALTFAGVLVLGPVLVPALITALGRVSGRLLGPAGRLASGNAVRNPRRTAATTASLLIGVTLTTAVLTGMSSSRSALTEEMNRQHPVDIAVTGAGQLPDDFGRRVADVADVAETATLDGTTAEVGDLGEHPVLAAPGSGDDAARRVVRAEDLPRPGPRQVLVPPDALTKDLEVGDTVVVKVGDRTERLRVAGAQGWGAAALVSRATLERLAPDAGAQAIWVRATDNADPEDLAGAIEALAGPADAEVENGLSSRTFVFLQLDVMTGGVVGLLGIAVVIALVGIANTLGLSVLERGREHALLRALGLTRRQLRTMLGAEAILLSVVATLLGTVLGVVFAWVGVLTLVEPAIPNAGLVLPWGQLALVVTISGVAGLLACLMPARRAARVTPAAGLALE